MQVSQNCQLVYTCVDLGSTLNDMNTQFLVKSRTTTFWLQNQLSALYLLGTVWTGGCAPTASKVLHWIEKVELQIFQRIICQSPYCSCIAGNPKKCNKNVNHFEPICTSRKRKWKMNGKLEKPRQE